MEEGRIMRLAIRQTLPLPRQIVIQRHSILILHGRYSRGCVYYHVYRMSLLVYPSMIRQGLPYQIQLFKVLVVFLHYWLYEVQELLVLLHVIKASCHSLFHLVFLLQMIIMSSCSMQEWPCQHWYCCVILLDNLEILLNSKCHFKQLYLIYKQYCALKEEMMMK